MQNREHYNVYRRGFRSSKHDTLAAAVAEAKQYPRVAARLHRRQYDAVAGHRPGILRLARNALRGVVRYRRA